MIDDNPNAICTMAHKVKFASKGPLHVCEVCTRLHVGRDGLLGWPNRSVRFRVRAESSWPSKSRWICTCTTGEGIASVIGRDTSRLSATRDILERGRMTHTFQKAY